MASRTSAFTSFVDPTFSEQNALTGGPSQFEIKLNDLGKSGNAKQLKEFIRTSNWSLGDPLRPHLWEELCECQELKQPSLYKQMCQQYGEYDGNEAKLPVFVDTTYLQKYHVTKDGERAVAQIIYILGRTHPEVTYSPHLYNVACILMHYLNEDKVYHCVDALLTAQPMCIHQSRASHEASALVLKALLKKHVKKTYDWLRHHVTDGDDLDAFFSDWQLWIFRDLPFSHLVRVVDCYLSEGVKVLYRVAMAILLLFHKQHVHKSSHINSIKEGIVNFCTNDMTAIAIQIVLKQSFGIRGMSRKEIMKLTRKKEMYMQSVHHSHYDYTDLQPAAPRSSRDLDDRSRSFDEREVNSALLTSEHWDALWRWIPERVTLLEPTLLYSSAEHGCSLTAFYGRVSDREVNPATIMVVKTTEGEIFGAYCSTDWDERLQQDKPLHFFGTGESFVFTLVPQMVKYPWVGVGKQEQPVGTACLFMAGDQKQIMIGAGGGGIALSLDQELLHGRTERSQTFENAPLASNVNFTAARVEVFGFVSS